MGNFVTESFICAVLASLLVSATSIEPFGEPCEGYRQSEIYCYGGFLQTVQQADLYTDQKTFVDRPLKYEPEVVLQKFKELGIKKGEVLSQSDKKKLAQFLDENFDRNGTEFEPWNPTDWIEQPPFLKSIEDLHLRNWADQLHHFWKKLGRKIREDVKVNTTKYSMYYVSHPVIVPGGRFKEFYYWDSYWIQRGLLVSGMTSTVKGMIENFFEMVDMLGFIPNGGRIYYQRSQPPLLLPMVDSYYEATHDTDFIRKNIHLMIKEFNFFLDHRTVAFPVNGKLYVMARYNVERTGPRPESYSDDFETVNSLPLNKVEEEVMYANLKSGAESGWDFSSRWFVMDNNDSLIEGNLTNTKTRDIIPVDLNSFIYWNAKLLEKFCTMINNKTVCDPVFYQTKAEEWKTAIYDVLWDEDAGTWFDYDFVRSQKRKYFFPTNLTPLWVQAHYGDTEVIAKRTVGYLYASGSINFPGGIPTSMLQTGQQWDFPNGWPPLNHIVVEALENTNETTAQDLAFRLAEKWVQSNHLAYLQTGAMFEKYDVSILGAAGSGGEYEVVVGFGWSNGVILDFLKKFGDRLSPVPNLPPAHAHSASSKTSEISAWVFISSLIAFFVKRLC